MEKGLNLLLNKYAVNADAHIGSVSVSIDGKEYPLLPWENERRFVELRNLVNGRVGQLCTYRIGHTAQKGTDLWELLYREAGIVEFTTGSPVKEVFALQQGQCMNAILETENGCVCTVELAATLTEGNVDKHEIITDNGIACDRVVDTQVPQSSIYVMGKENKCFTDVDAELYGYSIYEASLIRNAFALAQNPALREENAQKAAHLKEVVAAAKNSIETLENVKVGG